MSSAYFGISVLKKNLPEKQLRIFLSYLPQIQLKEYLSMAEIYNGRKNMSKHDLIDMIITGKNKHNIYVEENTLSKEVHNMLEEINKGEKKRIEEINLL